MQYFADFANSDSDDVGMLIEDWNSANAISDCDCDVDGFDYDGATIIAYCFRKNCCGFEDLPSDSVVHRHRSSKHY